ncbi:copper-binding periplasmic metallochaperone CueP [Yersinia rohdei]|uniref:copper-binding periplasmic metallochaperone CueP n=1 Tax=Yersinia rohdei TaxID=29485 RepID=UPI0025AB3ED6|nr:copper-binding periplasmic metallochaperone CueP [Yersinia rohdei]MDN0096781.1 copper-binding periplasmic metallochaperone CueP [Yersinia rohdei]
MNKTFAVTAQLAMVALAAVTFSHFALAQSTANAETDFLAQQGLAGKTTEQMIESIDQSKQPRPLAYSASVTGTELKLSDGQQQFSFPLGDKFYLSFAPYISQTHPCFNHSLSGCRGELANTAFDVKITDKAGKVIVQDKLTSYQNGFIGVWLPRNTEGTIEVSYQGLKAVSPFATQAESQTCMTTLQLKK